MNPRLAATFVLALAALASAPPAAAARLDLPAPASGDLVVTGPLVERAPAVDADRRPVAVSWPLPAGSPLRSAVAPFVADSREHWFRVTAAELEAGVDPAIASRGAILRLSPLAADRDASPPAAPALEDFVLLDVDGGERRGGEAVAALADPDALAAAGLELPQGSTALRLRPELGDGPFVLRLEGAAASGATGYLVQVFEPHSEVVLELGAGRAAWAAGEKGEITVALRSSDRPVVPGEIVGFVRSPGGRAERLEFVAGADGRLRAGFAARGEDGRAGLWQAEVAVTTTVFGPGGGGPVEKRPRPKGNPRTHRRTARTAFAVALPTARLAGELEVAGDGAAGGFALDVPVEVASAGRYAVRANFAQRHAGGATVAVARAESAAWLEPGSGRIRLELAAEALAGAMPGVELELVELELVDPGRLGLLERRALELPLDARP